VTLVLAACGAGEKPVPFVDVSTQLHDVQFPRLVRELFRSRSELVGYLGRALPGRPPAAPTIDFAHREAILVAMGPRSSTGYALHVVKVRETSDRIAITVRERTPSLGEPVVPRITYPFVLITIPRIDKKLLLHIQGRP
jgi:PrcB C-terminal